jgi:hypothetical protein
MKRSEYSAMVDEAMRKGRKKVSAAEALVQAKKLMALKPKKRFRLPEGTYLSTDAISGGCKVTISNFKPLT